MDTNSRTDWSPPFDPRLLPLHIRLPTLVLCWLLQAAFLTAVGLFVLFSLLTDRGLLYDGFLPPFNARLAPVAFNWLWSVPVATFAAYMGFLVLARPSSGLPRRVALGSLLAFAVLLPLSLTLVRGVQPALIAPITEAPDGYYGDIYRVANLGSFLRQYVEFMPTLHVHSSTHPPGPILLLALLFNVLHLGGLGVTLTLVALSALTTVPVYLVIHHLLGSTRAFWLTAMYILTPSILIFSATSLNMIYALSATLSAAVAYMGIVRGSPLAMIAGGALLALSVLMAFELAVIGVFISGMVVWYGIASRNWRNALFQLLLLLAGFAVVFALLYFATGFNIVEAFQVARDNHIRVYAGDRSYAYWTFLGNPIAFLTLLGAPTALLLVKAAVQQPVLAVGHPRGMLTPLATIGVPFLVTLLLLNLSGVVRGETERLWLFLVPWAVLTAWGAVASDERKLRALTLASAPVAFLQAFLLEVMLDLA